MGHIANKIDAKDKKLSEVLNEQRYRIDSFQREYRWQWKQIEALISDITTSFKRNHDISHTIKDCSKYDCYYMGPIVLCVVDDELSIVDGQQRLTSFTLLIIYLLHEQSKIKNPNLVLRDLKKHLYVTQAGETTFILNVKSRNKVIEQLIASSNPIFNEIENLEDCEDFEQDEIIIDKSTDESIQNLIGRYEDITKLFPDDLKNEKVLPLFIEWLLMKVVIVEVKAYSIENAYTIFETMNDRGLTLNPTEILKAYLLHKINDDKKSDEVNRFWIERISDLKSSIGDDSELEFFRAWFRAKYAITIRPSKIGAENEDFELIGTNFHSWVKNNPQKTYLDAPEDFYFFIRSDFDYYSNLFIRLYKYKHHVIEEFEGIYISNFYPIADSLSYPLFLAPISKIDDDITINEKINLVGNFIDVFVNSRVILAKAITQSSIRTLIYELVKKIRNLDTFALKAELSIALEKSSNSFAKFRNMDNWGYFHYFYARILFHLGSDEDFSDLLRTRKQRSLILVRIFNEDDCPEGIDEGQWNLFTNSVAGYCLIRRYDWDAVFSKTPENRLKYIIKKEYMPEIEEYDPQDETIINFIVRRDQVIRELFNEIWAF